ncbi:MAG: hypothetical protein SPJ83_06035 [Helicobacter sp.]|uniref:hypothetical protein n=1 Tax=Helicobacter sp. TaxID=218 RepID=UPI002A90AA15|nr:hypothetical protein [Helicobacter sp.]MDY5822343.1 hypothetical protein [Helicobacter sp.]
MLKNKRIKSIVWVIGLIILVMILLKLDRLCLRYFGFSMPYVWIGGAFAIILLICAKRATPQGLKLAFIYIAIVPICVVISEMFFYYKIQSIKHTHIQTNKILGYANLPAISSNTEFIVDDKVIYNATYTHNKNGLRLTPNNNINSRTCLNIYGGSFAYGHGVGNSETIAAYLQKDLPQYNVKNFGIAGAGAHQMLARLEFDLDSNELGQCDENIFIYEAIPHHIYRSMGSNGGPKYINIDNTIVYQGTFTEEDWKPFEPDDNELVSEEKGTFFDRIPAFKKIKEQLTRPYALIYFFSPVHTTTPNAYKSEALLANWRFEKGYGSNPDLVHLNVTQDHIYFDIIRKINKILKEQYNAKLYVIYWDYDITAQFLDKYDEVVQTTLKNDSIPFYTMSEIIGDDYKEDLERVKNGDFEHFKYRISRWDIHPNALANEKIAEFIATQIKNGTIKPSRLQNSNTPHDKPNERGQE